MRLNVEERLTRSGNEIWIDTTGLTLDEAEAAEAHVRENFPVEDITGLDMEAGSTRLSVFKLKEEA